MPARIEILRAEHTAQELRCVAAKLKDARQARRLQAVSLVMDGWSRQKVANFIAADRQTVGEWVGRYNEGGIAALETAIPPGRPRLLTPAQEDELLQVVLKGPDLEKDGIVRWRCVDLTKEAAERFSMRKVHPSTMAKWLNRMNLTKLTARPFHPESDPVEQQEFIDKFKEKVDEKLPAAVKRLATPLEFWFQDEARVGQQGTLSRVWALVGSKPRMPRDNGRENAYIYGAICPARGVGVALVMPSVNTEAMNAHLAAVSQKVEANAHAVLICDGAGWHEASKELVVPKNVTLVTLPPYSPELNPMETVWEFLRDNRFGAQVWKTYEAVVSACCDAWNWFASSPARITSIGTRSWVHA